MSEFSVNVVCSLFSQRRNKLDLKIIEIINLYHLNVTPIVRFLMIVMYENRLRCDRKVFRNPSFPK